MVTSSFVGYPFLSALWQLFLLVLVVVVFPAIYFLPSIVAYKRKVPNRGSVAVINLFLGWSLIGWVVALAMAFRTVPSAPHQAPSGPTFIAMYRECPHCKIQMRRDASVCPHCRMTSDPWVYEKGYWFTHDDAGRWVWLDEATGKWSADVEEEDDPGDNEAQV